MSRMQVPVYRRQTMLPGQTGTGRLSAKASPESFAAPGKAYSQLGATVSNVSNTWAEQFIKTDNAVLQAEEEGKVDTYLEQLKRDAYERNVADEKNVNGSTQTYFERRNMMQQRLDAELKIRLAGVTNKAVKTRLASVFREKRATGMSAIDALLRPKYLSHGRAVLQKHVDENRERIAAMAPGPVKNQAINDAKLNAAYIKNLAPMIGDKVFADAFKNFDADLGELEMRRHLGDVKTSQQATDFIRYLENPQKTDPYYDAVKRMKSDDIQKMVERLQRQKNTLVTSEHTAEGRKIRADKTRLTAKREQTYDTLRDRALRVRTALAKGMQPSDANWPKHTDGPRKGEGMVMPTMSEITGIGDRLTGTQSTTIRNLVTGNDAVYNAEDYRKFELQILDAVTDDDLDVIEGDFRDMFDKNIIGGKAYDKLRAEVKSARLKTPEYVEKQRYAKLLGSAFSTALMIDGGTGARPTKYAKDMSAGDSDMAKAIGMTSYQRRLDDGMRPVEAFYETVQEITAKQDKVAMAAVRALKASLDYEFPPELFQVGGMGKLTSEMVTAARQAFRDSLTSTQRDRMGLSQEELGRMQRQERNPLSKKDRLGVRALFLQETQLNFLDRYISAKDEAARQTSGGGGGGNNTGGNNTGGNNASNATPEPLTRTNRQGNPLMGTIRNMFSSDPPAERQ